MIKVLGELLHETLQKEMGDSLEFFENPVELVIQTKRALPLLKEINKFPNELRLSGEQIFNKLLKTVLEQHKKGKLSDENAAQVLPFVNDYFTIFEVNKYSSLGTEIGSFLKSLILSQSQETSDAAIQCLCTLKYIGSNFALIPAEILKQMDDTLLKKILAKIDPKERKEIYGFEPGKYPKLSNRTPSIIAAHCPSFSRLTIFKWVKTNPARFATERLKIGEKNLPLNRDLLELEFPVLKEMLEQNRFDIYGWEAFVQFIDFLSEGMQPIKSDFEALISLAIFAEKVPLPSLIGECGQAILIHLSKLITKLSAQHSQFRGLLQNELSYPGKIPTLKEILKMQKRISSTFNSKISEQLDSSLETLCNDLMSHLVEEKQRHQHREQPKATQLINTFRDLMQEITEDKKLPPFFYKPFSYALQNSQFLQLDELHRLHILNDEQLLELLAFFEELRNLAPTFPSMRTILLRGYIQIQNESARTKAEKLIEDINALPLSALELAEYMLILIDILIINKQDPIAKQASAAVIKKIAAFELNNVNPEEFMHLKLMQARFLLECENNAEAALAISQDSLELLAKLKIDRGARRKLSPLLDFLGDYAWYIRSTQNDFNQDEEPVPTCLGWRMYDLYLTQNDSLNSVSKEFRDLYLNPAHLYPFQRAIYRDMIQKLPQALQNAIMG